MGNSMGNLLFSDTFEGQILQGRVVFKGYVSDGFCCWHSQPIPASRARLINPGVARSILATPMCPWAVMCCFFFPSTRSPWGRRNSRLPRRFICYTVTPSAQVNMLRTGGGDLIIQPPRDIYRSCLVRDKVNIKLNLNKGVDTRHLLAK